MWYCFVAGVVAASVVAGAVAVIIVVTVESLVASPLYFRFALTGITTKDSAIKPDCASCRGCAGSGRG